MFEKQTGAAPIKGGRAVKSTADAFNPPLFAKAVLALSPNEWFMVPKRHVKNARRYLTGGELFMPDRSHSIRAGLDTEDYVLMRVR